MHRTYTMRWNHFWSCILIFIYQVDYCFLEKYVKIWLLSFKLFWVVRNIIFFQCVMFSTTVFQRAVLEEAPFVMNGRLKLSMHAHRQILPLRNVCWPFHKGAFSRTAFWNTVVLTKKNTYPYCSAFNECLCTVTSFAISVYRE